MKVGIVVPTKDSARTLESCLTSLRNQTVPCEIVVVDNSSDDATMDIGCRLAHQFVVGGPERSAQRNIGANLLGEVEILGFIDSDMALESTVVAEASALIESGADAVVVPEYTIGSGFFAAVRTFERAQYVNASRVEAARFFRAHLFRAVGGFDEELTAAEDWDLGLRFVSVQAVVRHTKAAIWHDEGVVRYLPHCRKKGGYAVGLRAFLAKHGQVGRAVLLDRPYLKRPWTLLKHPLMAAGLVTLKSGETVAVALALTRQRRSEQRAAPTRKGDHGPN